MRSSSRLSCGTNQIDQADPTDPPVGSDRLAMPVSHVSHLLLPLCDQLRQPAERSYDSGGLELDGLVTVVLGRFMRFVDEGSDDAADSVGTDVAWIRQSSQSPTSVPALARRSCCSESHFHREFRRRTGRSSVEFLTTVRIAQAMKWRRNSSLTVAESARLAGFRAPFYFSRAFRQATGLRPLPLAAPDGGGSLRG